MHYFFLKISYILNKENFVLSLVLRVLEDTLMRVRVLKINFYIQFGVIARGLRPKFGCVEGSYCARVPTCWEPLRNNSASAIGSIAVTCTKINSSLLFSLTILHVPLFFTVTSLFTTLTILHSPRQTANLSYNDYHRIIFRCIM
jgi:hypothetical protein